MKIFIGVVYSLLPEIVLLIAAALVSHFIGKFPPGGILALELVTLCILLVALALSIQFNRRRIFFAVLSLLVACAGLLLAAGMHDGLRRQILSGGLCLLLPLNLVWMQALAERGVFTRRGSWPFGLLIVEILFVAACVGIGARAIAAALYVEFMRWPVLAATGISQPGLLLLALGLLWLNDRLIRRHSPELAAFFFSLVAAAAVLHTQAPGVMVAFAAAAGIAFGFAIVLESWSMAYEDELTGLPGRRALEEQLRQLGNRYVIAMLDVDHFKRFNDSYGHAVGDQVLRLVASRLQNAGGGGKAFRYGGEEFTLVFPGRTLDEAGAALEALRADLATSGFSPRRQERRNATAQAAPADIAAVLRITVSIGAADCDNSRRDPWKVLMTADRALYKAKQTGRNQVCLEPA
ncbi:MAG: GGDEF domain-containing protein [Gammaproteobacteria bacterium]|nr:GGDEF domain-containing protein [Gammaproteobacteria bacterium]MDE2023142.1 GGDEF domain-containing protein [Gammaproteobacteria bacterium]MDE2139567.1 GGDEF domain-containing protein [Gammaproteobacteria bacterium]MDE2273891.1 GGDEF domain-containing protein [Gammaproteobacteria bacterium]